MEIIPLLRESYGGLRCATRIATENETGVVKLGWTVEV